MNQYPITLSHAKDIAKQRLGRLPRVGYSIVVGGIFINNPPVREWSYMLSLVNHSGRFYLQAWEKPFSYNDLLLFRTIEHEKDTRYDSIS